MPDTETEQPQPTDTTTEPQSDSDGLGDAGKRAIEAERTARKTAEQQAKAFQEQLEAATLRVSAFEAANNDLTAQITANQQTILRQNIGLAKGLPTALIERLRGDDEAALNADADSLLALLPQQTPTVTAPRPDLSQGSRAPATTSPADEFANALRRATGR
jgi:sulfite reductase alpha subunit-like flavoprotein